ncbi:hypothetical protein E7V67_011575 [[Empedobacter] haloabium]|uniref:HK97 gp10 family phage protein n=1 Tax=[Empedobacter] haloabium TaxID=592317 RepID=A0ABZ1UT56_9BURK
MSFTVDISELAGLRERLAEFGEQVQDDVAMSGVAAMARVVYTEARLLAPRSERAHWFHGTQFRVNGTKYLFQPGTLHDSIYRKFSPERSSKSLKLYRVSWNHRKCPYGFMVEFGTRNAGANSFLRRSMARVPDAINAGKAAIGEALTRVGGAT